MVQKERGRPRAFDPENALSAATEVFWAKGFDGASLDDLTEAMGISRPSLYAAFGDKERLFEAALGHYANHFGAEGMMAFQSETNIRRAVELFLEVALDNAARDGDRRMRCFRRPFLSQRPAGFAIRVSNYAPFGQ